MSTAMGKKRVLVVDDSVFARKTVSDMLASSPAIEVVGTAANGVEALALIDKLRPDAVTMDVEMPVMNGIETLKRIMAENPTPVVMLSSLTASGTSESIRALALGAVEVMAKPNGITTNGVSSAQRSELIDKVLAAADARLANIAPIKTPTANSKVQQIGTARAGFPVVVIASSTGGPRALRTIVPDLPTAAGVAYVVIQHLPEGFSGPLARDLNTFTELNVRESSDGDVLQPGDLILARAGFHTIFERDKSTRLSNGPTLWGVRPAADVTIASMVEVYGSRLIGVVLTGMGHDGANGTRLIKQAGGVTIAEHESTCVVYGMPRSAVETGAVDHVVPLTDMTSAIDYAISQVTRALRKHQAA